MTQFISARIKLAIRPSFLIIIFCLPLLALACSGSRNLVSSVTSTSSDEPFEGLITTRVLMGNEFGEMKTWVKGAFTRTETITPSNAGNGGGPLAVAILDLSSRTQIVLSPRTKTYTEDNLDEVAERVKKLAGTMKIPLGLEKTTTMTKVTSAGKQETVAGCTCQHWLVETGDITTDYCFTKDLKFLGTKTDSVRTALNLIKGASLDSKMADQYPEFEKFAEDPIFPVKAVMITEGTSKLVSEVIKVERKPVDASVFTIPSGYQRAKTPSLPTP